jgi:hypothetical protein
LCDRLGRQGVQRRQQQGDRRKHLALVRRMSSPGPESCGRRRNHAPQTHTHSVARVQMTAEQVSRASSVRRRTVRDTSRCAESARSICRRAPRRHCRRHGRSKWRV